MTDLNEIREKIDAIDAQIIALFEERMKISEEVARYKISVGKPVYDPEREQQKISAAMAQTHNELNAAGVEALFKSMMTTSRIRQNQLMEECGKAGLATDEK